MPSIRAVALLLVAVVVSAGITILTGPNSKTLNVTHGTQANVSADSTSATGSADAVGPVYHPSGLAQSTQIGDLVVMLTVSPGATGINEVNVMHFGVGAGGGEAELESITLSYLDYGGVQMVVVPTETHLGHAYFGGLQLPHEGRWRLEAVISGANEDITAVFDLGIGSSEDAPAKRP